MNDQTQPEVTEPSYSYKPSLMGAPFMFQLRESGLEWGRGYRVQAVPYRDIARLRLSYRPATMLSARYELEIWPKDAPRIVLVSASWRSMVEMQSQLPAYRSFVLELHRRIGAAGGEPRCETGVFPPLYWLGVTVFVVSLVWIAALVVRALQLGTWSGAAFVAAFFGIFLWQGERFFRRNKPGRYPLGEPPARLLPAD